MDGTADVAVVGDGVVGASIAYHLAAAGAQVALLTRGGGFERSATRHSAGQVRMHHSDPHDARLAALSMETFEHWPEIVGGDCGFRRTGFAFLVDDAHTGTLARTVAELVGLGVETSVLTPGELAGRYPALRLDGVHGVAYEPRSGYADSDRTVSALIDRARALGTVLHRGISGAELRIRGSRITGVALDGERISAGQVVIAAGAGSAELCAAAGIRLGPTDGGGPPQPAGLPVHTRDVGWAVADTTRIPGAASLCMVIDDTVGTYFRPDGQGHVLFRLPLNGQELCADTPNIAPRSSVIDDGRALAAHRLPGITTAPVTRASWASEVYTPDGRALIGPVARHPGLYLATAFNGGGFKTAPAVGRAVAAELVEEAQRPELAVYRPDRFAARQLSPIIPRYRHM